ncbi:MAG: DsrE family protein [Sulfurospirillaceae bacterium]|nr:DsrE family protein [Sulfurospirillaceae bacterium]
MKKLLLILLIGTFAFAKVDYAEKAPTFDNPRNWLIRVNNSNTEKVNHILNAVNNVLKGYPEEALHIEIVFYANGIRAVRKDYNKEILKRIKSLMLYDTIRFVVCKNTMDTMNWHKKDFISGVDYVQIGIAEAIERVADGWIDVSPY